MGIHGSFFYISMRRWIYGQNVYGDSVDQVCGEPLVRDRVMTYLHASRLLLGEPAHTAKKRSAKK